MGGGAGGGAALAEVMLGWIGSKPMGMAYAKARKTGGGWAGGSEVGGESGDEGESGDAGSGTLRTSGFTCGSVCVVCIGGGGAAAERRKVGPDGRTAVRREAAREKPEVFTEHTWPSLGSPHAVQRFLARPRRRACCPNSILR